MLKLASVLGAALLFTTPAIAQSSEAKDTRAAEDPNKIVCQKEEQIGSRLGAKKVCMTAKEWELLAKEHRDEAERLQLNAQAPRSN